MDKKSWAAPKKLSHSIDYGGWLIWILIMDDDHGENILGGIPGIPPKKRSSTNLNYPQPRMRFSSVTSSTTHRQQGPPHPFSRLWSNQGIKNAWWVKAIRTVQRSNASISPWISLGVSTEEKESLEANRNGSHQTPLWFFRNSTPGYSHRLICAKRNALSQGLEELDAKSLGSSSRAMPSTSENAGNTRRCVKQSTGLFPAAAEKNSWSESDVYMLFGSMFDASIFEAW